MYFLKGPSGQVLPSYGSSGTREKIMKTINYELNLPLVENVYANLGVSGEEDFKVIFEDSDYLIGNLGTVISLKGDSPYKLTTKSKKYHQVSLQLNEGKTAKAEYVHRLVAMHFIPRYRKEAKHVNHKDGRPSNNQQSNLEWVTPQENMKHAIDTGLMFSREAVYEIYDEDGNFVNEAFGATGLRAIWGDNYQDKSYYNRVSKKEPHKGLTAKRVGTVGEIYGEEGARVMFHYLDGKGIEEL